MTPVVQALDTVRKRDAGFNVHEEGMTRSHAPFHRSAGHLVALGTLERTWNLASIRTP